MKIVLIDDHEIFRLGLRALLEAEPTFEIVGEASNGNEGFKVVVESSPDVVVLDYSMPGVSGLEVLSQLRSRFKDLRIILLTASKSESVLSEALAAGAHGVVLKQDSSSQLIQAIEAVSRGEQIISTSIVPLIKRFNAMSDLTKRERQVLRMITNGYRNREISDELNISMKTVDTHRTNLMRKLNLHNVVDVIEFANKIGILDSTI
ncbi:MAG: response regulator transcription factor [Gammaproteobacteria bacterium]|nr:response regulator transcription factor [Gammaproteobacteria bacterium]MBL4890654.1 response regulator transcription factor [Rhizobiaceae bacterium]